MNLDDYRIHGVIENMFDVLSRYVPAPIIRYELGDDTTWISLKIVFDRTFFTSYIRWDKVGEHALTLLAKDLGLHDVPKPNSDIWHGIIWGDGSLYAGLVRACFKQAHIANRPINVIIRAE